MNNLLKVPVNHIAELLLQGIRVPALPSFRKSYISSDQVTPESANQSTLKFSKACPSEEIEDEIHISEIAVDVTCLENHVQIF